MNKHVGRVEQIIVWMGDKKLKGQSMFSLTH